MGPSLLCVVPHLLSYLLSKHVIASHQRPVSETSFRHVNGVSLADRLCPVIAGWVEANYIVYSSPVPPSLALSQPRGYLGFDIGTGVQLVFFIPTLFMYSSFQKCIPIRV